MPWRIAKKIGGTFTVKNHCVSKAVSRENNLRRMGFDLVCNNKELLGF